MSDVQTNDRTEKSPLRTPIFSPRLSIAAMATQLIFCGLAWAFVGRMLHDVIPLPDRVARLVYDNPSDTNMLVTVLATVLAMIGSSLLRVTVEFALLFRLTRGVPLSLVAPWVQLARNSIFLRPRHFLGWTLVSILWVIVTGLLTSSWNNLLTPVMVTENFKVSGKDVDYQSPAVYDLLRNLKMPSIHVGTQNYSLTPDILGYLSNITGYLSEAGRAAAAVYLDAEYPSFIAQFNTSTGGINPAQIQYQLTGSDYPSPSANFQGLSTSWGLTQQGYTADISCKALPSPAITLNSTASVEFEIPNTSVNFTLETWSWNTGCAGNASSYTGEVDLLTKNGSFIGNGLFATSVCFYQDFSGPSNQSFLVIMQSPNNSIYSNYYFAADHNLPIVCQVTPVVTTLDVQYSRSGLVNVIGVRDRAPLSSGSWPLTVYEGYTIWAAFYFSQGPYSNAMADTLLQVVNLLYSVPHSTTDITILLEHYLQGIFEYMSTDVRGSIITHFQGQLPKNMTIQNNGTMYVQTMGWKLNAKTHSIDLAVISLVTIMTVVSGISVLLEADSQHILRDTLQGFSFNPTNVVDVLLASSMGGLSAALSQYDSTQKREDMVVKLTATKDGLPVLTHLDDKTSRVESGA